MNNESNYNFLKTKKLVKNTIKLKWKVKKDVQQPVQLVEFIEIYCR